MMSRELGKIERERIAVEDYPNSQGVITDGSRENRFHGRVEVRPWSNGDTTTDGDESKQGPSRAIKERGG